MEPIGIVVANGIIEDFSIIRLRLKKHSVEKVIVADGGVHAASQLGLKPDLIVGDMDSINSEEGLLANTIEFEHHPPAKDQTDLELALEAAVREESRHWVVLGATGGRLDMTIGNAILLAHPMLVDLKIELWHNYQTAWLIRPPGEEISGQPGDTLSLLSICGDVNGITLTNMAYPLQDATLEFGQLRGISNLLNATPAKVSMSSGILLAVHTPGSRLVEAPENG